VTQGGKWRGGQKGGVFTGVEQKKGGTEGGGGITPKTPCRYGGTWSARVLEDLGRVIQRRGWGKLKNSRGKGTESRAGGKEGDML